MDKIVIYSILLLVCFTCPVRGQAVPGCLEKIRSDKVNDMGTALTYKKSCGNTQSVVLRNLLLEQDYIIEGKVDETILTNDCFIYFRKADRVINVVQINGFTTETFTDVDTFFWLEERKKMLLYSSFSKTLRYVGVKKSDEVVFEKVAIFSVNDSMLFIANEGGETMWIDLNSGKKKEFFLPELKSLVLKKVLWCSKGKSVIVIGNTSEELKVFEITANGVGNSFKTNLFDEKYKTVIDTAFREVRLINEDKVALGVKSMKSGSKSTASYPEIWLSATGGITSQVRKNIAALPQLLVLDIKNNKSVNFFDHSKEMRYKVDVYDGTIYRYDENANNNFSQFYSDVSLQVYDENSKAFNFLKTFQGRNEILYNSTKAPLLYFFEKNRFFFYDKSIGKIGEVKSNGFGFNEPEAAEVKDWNSLLGQTVYPYSENDLILRDSYDYWLLDSKKNNLKKLTSGRKDSIHYKLESCNYTKERVPWAWNYQVEFKDYDNLLFSWNKEDYSEEGISVVKKGVVEEIFRDQAHISQIIRSKNYISFVKENANKPPELFYMDLRTKRVKSVYKSNVWDTVVSKLKIEYIQWENKLGEKRGAIVRYPVGYSKQKKYPAIFNIYEKRYMTRNYYYSALVLNTAGFNPHSYVQDHYFVIEPDIHYRLGSPGESAYESVEDALAVVLNRYSIDNNRLGIFGYSFGAYETNFIITQTNAFKAAVAGAGVSDLSGWYLSMGWDVMKPGIWRIENQQYRMGESLFQNKEAYIKNSPIFQSDNINTPLLLFAGKKDLNVDWNQSLAMFFALKRQEKQVNLILYPDEGHTIFHQKNLLDVNSRVKQWFDFYLKESDKPEWLNKGLD